jgi:hypothetical protein
VREEACVKGPGVSDVAVGVCWRGRVLLGGHYPSERREGRMDVDVDEFILVFFAHARRGWKLVDKGAERRDQRGRGWKPKVRQLNRH